MQDLQYAESSGEKFVDQKINALIILMTYNVINLLSPNNGKYLRPFPNRLDNRCIFLSPLPVFLVDLWFSTSSVLRALYI